MCVLLGKRLEIMSQEPSATILFKEQMRDLLLKETSGYRTIKIATRDQAYNHGDKDSMVYFIKSGQIKLVMISPEGKECILAIHSQGDIFGEMCLSGLGERQETATAMQQTELKQIPSVSFYKYLSQNSLLEGFVKYLTVRIAEQQQLIASLVTVNSEQRLGKKLLQLACSIGKPHFLSSLIGLKISHEELSEMIGTTRPRITLFMQRFCQLGLIETTKEHFLIIKEKKLFDYLAQIA